MVYVIKDAIEGKKEAHKFFVRFGKGKFDGRFALRIARKINASFENVPSIILFISNQTDAIYNGKILARKEVDELLKAIGFNIINKKVGKLVEYDVEGEIKKNGISKIYNEVYYLLLDVKANGIEFKCKKKLPKPSAKGAMKIDDKFCSLSLSDKYFDAFKKEFLFDVPDGKKIEINHTIVVEDIIIPKELEKSNDYEKIRLEALRKGKIIRKIKVDGKEIIKEYKFEI